MLLDIYRIIEKQFHDPVCLYPFIGKFCKGFFGSIGHHTITKFLILEIEIYHIIL